MSEKFYIRDVTHRGDLVLWWGPSRSGYTTCLHKAGLYTKEEAEQISRIRGTDVPHPQSEVDAVAVRVVLMGTIK